ncbi:MAG: hypothetical protein O7I93_04495 [Gemmatimonadetes bacterium]|nr:hypothetical protein [Gemmatimonadota bacterium]
MRISRVVLSLAMGAICVFAVSTPAAAQASHTHMGHVADGFGDTPDGAGLLPTAVAEAEIAAQHAGLAAGAGDLAGMKRHIAHVLNAIDPTVEASGPGKGYGVLKAAKGAATHIRLAAGADEASDNVKTHANHVGTAADNVAKWAERVVELGNQIKATDDAAAAAEMVAEVQEITQAILSGTDANDDGRTSWGENEGGLEQATFHMDLMKRGEG